MVANAVDIGQKMLLALMILCFVNWWQPKAHCPGLTTTTISSTLQKSDSFFRHQVDCEFAWCFGQILYPWTGSLEYSLKIFSWHIPRVSGKHYSPRFPIPNSK